MRHAAPELERSARLLRHFDVPPHALIVPTASLLPSRVDPAEKVERAAALMADAAGGGPKRAPLLVRPRGDGTYRVLDGNATLAAAERVGLAELPVVLEPGARSPGTLPTGEDIDRIVQAAFRRGDHRSGAVVAAQAALSAIGMPRDGYSVRTVREPNHNAHARILIKTSAARDVMVAHRDYLTGLGFNVIGDAMIGSFRYSDLRTDGGARRPSPLEEIAARHPEVELDGFERHDQGIVISLIRTPEGKRNRGLATAALKDVLAYADATGQVVAVTPDPIVRTPGGLSKSRLPLGTRAEQLPEEQGAGRSSSRFRRRCPRSRSWSRRSDVWAPSGRGSKVSTDLRRRPGRPSECQPGTTMELPPRRA